MNWLTGTFSGDSLKTGDWVNSYSKGIYRIEKIVENYYDESDVSILGNHKIGDKSDRTIVTKRLLNSKFKKSLGYECCSEAFVSKLNYEQIIELRKVLDESPNILNEFEQFKIPELLAIYNTQLQIDNKDDLNSVLKLVSFIEYGKSFLEIEKEMKQLDLERLKPRNFGNYDLQFINYDNEYKNRKKIWRKAILTKKQLK